MHIPLWAGPVALALLTSLLAIFKDALTEKWKQHFAKRVEEGSVKVAQIEAEQGRETRVSAEVWKLIETLQEQVKEVQDQLHLSETDRSTLRAQIEGMQARLQQFETMSKENAQLRNRVKKLQTELSQAKAELQGRRIGERSTAK